MSTTWPVGRDSSPRRTELADRVLEVGFIDDVVAVEHASGLVAGELHGDVLGNAGPDQIPHGGTPEVVGNALGQVRRQELDGHLALQARVLGRVDDAHPAVTEFGGYGVRTEGGTWREGHRKPDYIASRVAAYP